MTDKRPKKITGYTDLTFDPENANKGTQRGRGLISQSLEQTGAGRGIFADRNGTILGGNKTLEIAAEKGLKLKIVHTQGDELIVNVRDDLDLDDPTSAPVARKAAYFDNRSGEESLLWNWEQIGTDVDAGLDLGDMWTPDEFEKGFERLIPPLATQDDSGDGRKPASDASGATKDGDPDKDTDEGGSGPGNGSESDTPAYIRMVQLFFSTSQFDDFQAMIETLKTAYGTNNPTDTVIIALGVAVDRAKQEAGSDNDEDHQDQE